MFRYSVNGLFNLIEWLRILELKSRGCVQFRVFSSNTHVACDNYVKSHRLLGNFYNKILQKNIYQ
jgi:hypothetical protein